MGILGEKNIILPTMCDLEKATLGGLRGEISQNRSVCNCWQNSKYQEEV